MTDKTRQKVSPQFIANWSTLPNQWCSACKRSTASAAAAAAGVCFRVSLSSQVVGACHHKYWELVITSTMSMRSQVLWSCRHRYYERAITSTVGLLSQALWACHDKCNELAITNTMILPSQILWACHYKVLWACRDKHYDAEEDKHHTLHTTTRRGDNTRIKRCIQKYQVELASNPDPKWHELSVNIECHIDVVCPVRNIDDPLHAAP